MSNNNVYTDVLDANPKCSSIKSIDSGIYEMDRALTAITREIQRFYFTDVPSVNQPGEVKYFDRIVVYKSRLQWKKKQIKRLKQNVKICWILVKLLITSKEKEDWNLKKLIFLERERNVNSIQNIALIKAIVKKNISLEGFINIKNSINRGYNEITKTIIETPYTTDIPLLEKLNTIISECEKHNNNLCNEREKCLLFEQKNRFLQNKIKILVCNIESLKEELSDVKYELSKRDKEIIFYKSKLFKNIKLINETLETPHKDKTENSKITSCSLQTNLSSHLSLVKSLLIDQDRMINKLKTICDVILTTEK